MLCKSKGLDSKGWDPWVKEGSVCWKNEGKKKVGDWVLLHVLIYGQFLILRDLSFGKDGQVRRN